DAAVGFGDYAVEAGMREQNAQEPLSSFDIWNIRRKIMSQRDFAKSLIANPAALRRIGGSGAADGYRHGFLFGSGAGHGWAILRMGCELPQCYKKNAIGGDVPLLRFWCGAATPARCQHGGREEFAHA